MRDRWALRWHGPLTQRSVSPRPQLVEDAQYLQRTPCEACISEGLMHRAMLSFTSSEPVEERAGADAARYFPLCSASHTRFGVAGMSMWRKPVLAWSASTMALITAGGEPTAPASLAPLTPSGVSLHGTVSAG